MKRFGMLFVVIAFVVAAVAWVSPSTSTVGQDQTDERLAALETQVADQDGDIANLKKRVRVLETAVAENRAAPANTDSNEDAGASPDGAIALSGSGKKSTDPIELNGAYSMAATCAGGFFFSVDVVNVTNPDSFEFVNLFGEIPFDGSAVATFDGNRYAFSINCDADWTLTITPLS